MEGRRGEVMLEGGKEEKGEAMRVEEMEEGNGRSARRGKRTERKE